MINLSNKAAIRFKVKWKELEERSGDFWKVDIMMIGRVPMLLVSRPKSPDLFFGNLNFYAATRIFCLK